MPVVAKSPPLIFGGTPAPTPRPPVVTPTPKPAKTPTPTPTPVSIVPAGTSGWVLRHAQFIRCVDNVGSCFKRVEISDFNDQEFLDHSTVAMQDRYLAQEDDMYCSTAGVGVLSKALKRLGT